jgi:hypothetical protein
MSNYFDMNQSERQERCTNKFNTSANLSGKSTFESNLPKTQNAKNPATKPNTINNKPRCGTFMPKSGSKAYKTEKMNYNAFFPSQSVYAALCKRKVQKCRKNNLEYSHLRHNYVDRIFSLAERFKITDLTSHLGVTLMDSLCYSSTQANTKLELYAPACLLLAAKTIEFDGRIPSISKLRKAVARDEYSTDDYQKAELALLANVDWNPQFTSTLEFVEFFLAQGIVFSTDGYVTQSADKEALRENTLAVNRQPDQQSNKTGIKNSILTGLKFACSSETAKTIKYTNLSQKLAPLAQSSLIRMDSFDEAKINEIVSTIESSAAKLCNSVVREIDLVEMDPVVLACACIAYLRKINKIYPVWCEDLEELTGVQADSVYPAVEQFHKLFDRSMAPEQNYHYYPVTERYHTQETPANKNATSLIEYRLSEEQLSTAEQISEVNLKDFCHTTSQPCSMTSIDSGHSGSETSTQHTRRNETNKNFHIRKIGPPGYPSVPNSDPIRQPVRRATVSYRIQTNKAAAFAGSVKSSFARPPMQPILFKTRVAVQSTKNGFLAKGLFARQGNFPLASSESYPKKRIP